MELTIQAKTRDKFGKQNESLRKAGILPAVVYGPKQKPTVLQVSEREFTKVYRAAGENTLVNLVIEGQSGQKKVLIHDVAKHYMKDKPVHVDFYEVDLTRKIHAKIPVVITGTSPAVKEHGGVLVKNLSEIEVEALPGNLPHSIEIDVSRLATFEDTLRLSDIDLSESVKILGSPEEVVASVQPPRSEEELEELEKPTAEAEKAAVEAVAAEPAKEGEEGSAEAGAKKTGTPPESAKAEKGEKKAEPAKEEK